MLFNSIKAKDFKLNNNNMDKQNNLNIKSYTNNISQVDNINNYNNININNNTNLDNNYNLLNNISNSKEENNYKHLGNKEADNKSNINFNNNKNNKFYIEIKDILNDKNSYISPIEKNDNSFNKQENYKIKFQNSTSFKVNNSNKNFNLISEDKQMHG